MPPEIFEKMKPEFVSPIVLYLCSDGCNVSGQIFNTGMGYFNRVAVLTGPGAQFGDERQLPHARGDQRKHRQAINDLSGAKEFD
jgi:hypothetical protein